MPDWADFVEWQARVNKVGTQPPAARHAQVAAIVGERLERLLAGDEWQTFRAHLQVLIDQDDQALAALREQMDQGLLVGDDLARANLRSQRLLGRLEARREDLALPATILEQQRVASDSLTAGGAA